MNRPQGLSCADKRGAASVYCKAERGRQLPGWAQQDSLLPLLTPHPASAWSFHLKQHQQGAQVTPSHLEMMSTGQLMDAHSLGLIQFKQHSLQPPAHTAVPCLASCRQLKSHQAQARPAAGSLGVVGTTDTAAHRFQSFLSTCTRWTHSHLQDTTRTGTVLWTMLITAPGGTRPPVTKRTLQNAPHTACGRRCFRELFSLAHTRQVSAHGATTGSPQKTYFLLQVAERKMRTAPLTSSLELQDYRAGTQCGQEGTECCLDPLPPRHLHLSQLQAQGPMGSELTVKWTEWTQKWGWDQLHSQTFTGLEKASAK